MNHLKLLDYAYDTNPNDDIADEPTDKHTAITLKTKIVPIPLQGFACIAAIPPLCAYAVLIANQNAALDGIPTKDYLEKLIFADQAARREMAAME